MPTIYHIQTGKNRVRAEIRGRQLPFKLSQPQQYLVRNLLKGKEARNDYKFGGSNGHVTLEGPDTPLSRHQVPKSTTDVVP